MNIELTPSESEQVGTILSRRANEIAGYKCEHSCEKYPLTTKPEMVMPASVEYALELEINRLRKLASKVNPPKPESEE